MLNFSEVFVGRFIAGEHSGVYARSKMGACRGNHDDADAVILLERADHKGQFVPERSNHAISFFRTIEHDMCDMVGDRDFKAGCVHGVPRSCFRIKFSDLRRLPHQAIESIALRPFAQSDNQGRGLCSDT